MRSISTEANFSLREMVEGGLIDDATKSMGCALRLMALDNVGDLSRLRAACAIPDELIWIIRSFRNVDLRPLAITLAEFGALIRSRK